MTKTQIIESSGGTQAVDRAAYLLTLVVEADEPVTFATLIEATGLARSTLSRLLASLESNRLLERCGTGEYIGGPLFVLYAARHDRNAELARLAQPVLEKIGADAGETVHLAVANGGRVAHVAQVDGTYLLGTRDWTEIETAAHCSALGKVLLAWGALELPEGDLDTPTPATISTRKDLDRELDQVRSRGFAVTRDELEVGLAGIAVPVYGPDEDVVAAIGISAPTARLEDRVDQMGRLLKEETQPLSRQLRRGAHTEGVA